MNINDADLILSCDTEYVSASAFNAVFRANGISEKIIAKLQGDNFLLSLQFGAKVPGYPDEAYGLIDIPLPNMSSPKALREHKSARIALNAAISRAISGANKARLFKDHTGGRLPSVLTTTKGKPRAIKIVLVGHFSRADLGGFKDAKGLFRSTDALRGTFASVDRPIVRDIWIDGVLRRVNIVLFDTKLLSPAGKGSLSELGKMLAVPKLSVPDVRNEAGELIPGITRMDLARAQHPHAFKEYALRDCLVTVRWLEAVGAFANRWGVAITPKTVASLAVNALFEHVDVGVLGRTLGRGLNLKGTRLADEPHPEVLAIQRICADAFAGGANLSFANGLYAPRAGRVLGDYDLSGAYTVALAFLQPIDHKGIFHTRDMNLLATVERMTFARVRFDFSGASTAGRKYPNLPIDVNCVLNPETGRLQNLNMGLTFPLKGEGTYTGIELALALDLGAQLELIGTGIVIPWECPNGDGPRPFVDFTRLVNTTRKACGKGTVFELMAKECGNSIFGKAAQAVTNMKSRGDQRSHFDSRSGKMKLLEPSAITCAYAAAYATAIPRSALLEMVATLHDTTLLSCTTDGLLSDANGRDIVTATRGRACTLFKRLRRLVDPKNRPKIIEKKHAALSVLQIRTRGQFSLETAAGSKPISAKAGHRLKDRPTKDDGELDVAAENAIFAELHRNRVYGQTLLDKRPKSIRDQWRDGGDLTMIDREIALNLEFDFKRRAINVREVDGLLKFETLPWETAEEFLAFRKLFEAWRAKTESCLVNLADWQDFQKWLAMSACQRRLYDRRTPYAQALTAIAAMGSLPGVTVREGRGRPSRGASGEASGGKIYSLQTLADALKELGVKAISRAVLMHLRRLGTPSVRECSTPEQAVTLADFTTPADEELILKVAATWGREAALAPLSEAGKRAQKALELEHSTEPETGTKSSENPGSVYKKQRCAVFDNAKAELKVTAIQFCRGNVFEKQKSNILPKPKSSFFEKNEHFGPGGIEQNVHLISEGAGAAEEGVPQTTGEQSQSSAINSAAASPDADPIDSSASITSSAFAIGAPGVQGVTHDQFLTLSDGAETPAAGDSGADTPAGDDSGAGGMSPSDRRDYELIRETLAREHNLGGQSIRRGREKARAMPGSPRQRAIAGLVHALAQKRRLTPPDAARIVAETAARVLTNPDASTPNHAGDRRS